MAFLESDSRYIGQHLRGSGTDRLAIALLQQTVALPGGAVRPCNAHRVLTWRVAGTLAHSSGAGAVCLPEGVIFLTHRNSHVSLRGFQAGPGLSRACLNTDIVDREELYFAVCGIAGRFRRSSQTNY